MAGHAGSTRRRGLGRTLGTALALGLALGLTLGPPMGGSGMAVAESGGKKASKPRSQVEDVPGDYMQLETLWVPVLTGRDSVQYNGLVVRLFPSPNHRYEACVRIPWMNEAILIDANTTPLTRQQINDYKYLAKRFASVVGAKAGPEVFAKVEVLGQFSEPDEDSALLSRTCK